MKSSVSVIIVNYNGAEYLDECIDSIQDRIPGLHEIILVDNASTDGSIDEIEDRHPKLRLIRCAENHGFAKGNNIGAAEATGDLLLLLNSDAMLQHDLSNLFYFVNGHSEIGVAGVRLVYGDGRLQPSVGYRHTPLRIILEWLFPKRITLLSPLQLQEKRPAYYDQIHCDTDWVAGAFLLTPRSLWQELGGLDQNIFMYVEDVDYCVRVKKAGYQVCYFPYDEVIHLEGGAGDWGSKRSFVETMRSYKLYLEKHHRNSGLRVVVLGLSLIFQARAVIHGVLQWIGVDNKGTHKAEIYRAAVRELHEDAH